MFRSFCDTDRSYSLRSKVGHGSTGSSPLGSPCVFTKVVEGALTPLREVGVRILNYLDDWLILAQSREQLGDPRDLVLRHLSQLGLRVNWEKSKLSPFAENLFSRCGVRLGEYDSTPHGGPIQGPEVGMAPRYTASGYHPAVSPLPQPLDGPCLSTGPRRH